MSDKTLKEIEVGDEVERLLAGVVPMRLKVTGVSKDRIYCGSWEFSRRNGAEIDEDLGWDEGQSGSYIKPV